jgi:hypothetical protein
MEGNEIKGKQRGRGEGKIIESNRTEHKQEKETENYSYIFILFIASNKNDFFLMTQIWDS